MNKRLDIGGFALAAFGCCLLAAAGCSRPKAPSGQLRISTEPAGAEVIFDGVTQDPSPVTLSNAAAGEHLIEVRKAGCEEARRTVDLAAEQRLALDVPLEPLKGLVLVCSQPPGAEVSVNDAVRGKTPLLMTDLPLGQYRVKLNLEGYMAKTVDLSLRDRVPLKVDVPLSSDSASLALESEPAGASVTVNGAPAGVTPCTVERIPPGECKLRIALEGYAPYESTLKLSVGQQQKLAVPLEPLLPQLTVVSLPEKARIYVDNQFRGETPLTLKDLQPGEYRIRAELAGYEPVARTVTMSKGTNTTEEFRLAGNFGTLEIVTDPPGVAVFVDDKPCGATEAKAERTAAGSRPLTVSGLSVGSHSVRFSREGYFTKEAGVEIKQDETTRLQQKLEREFKPNYEVTTLRTVERGILVKTDEAGNVQIEVRPGVFRTIPARDIRSQGPIEAP